MKIRLLNLLIKKLISSYRINQKLLLIVFIALSQNVIIAQNNLELDFCDYRNNNSFSKQLKSFKLKKGDFFTLKIRNINPYRYNIKITTKNDTFLVGKAPALLTQFMDPSSLVAITTSLKNNKKEAIISEIDHDLTIKSSNKEKMKIKLLKKHNLFESSYKSTDSINNDTIDKKLSKELKEIEARINTKKSITEQVHSINHIITQYIIISMNQC